MKTNRHLLGNRDAFVTVYMTFAILLLIPMVGLAIDFSVLYYMKDRIQQAVDAGAIGAGNEVQRSTDVTNPATNATLVNAVTRFFNANMTPVPWASTQINFTATVTQDTNTKIRNIHVLATYAVPALFLRVLGIKATAVSAEAYAHLRFVNLMLVVDRSGSVARTGSGTQTNQQIIEGDLKEFVAAPATSIFVDGRDVVGMVTFGGNYSLDYSPTTHFQTGSPAISAAINGIFFDNNSTNTGEGLYQAWYQIAQLNQTGALNVILLITDGRPSAFTGSFTVSANCTSGPKNGFIDSNVNDGNPWQFPPPSNRPVNGILKVQPPCNTSGCEATSVVTPDTGCHYASNPANVRQDIFTFPNPVGPLDHISGGNVPYQTTFGSMTGYVNAPDSTTSNPTSIRYAAYNYADNVATAIRKDTTYKPVIYAVGLNFDTGSYPSEEPLDADWLGRVANDPSYTGTHGQSVFQTGQTSGAYYNVSYSGLAAALHEITGQILRLATQ